MISITDFRQALGFDAGRDGEVIRIRRQVISQWERATRKLWDARTAVEREFRPPTRDEPLFIPAANVTVIEVKEWMNSEANDGEVLTLSDADNDGDYTVKLYPSHFAGIHPVCNHWWDTTVKVTYDCGYQTLPNELGDIREACIDQAQFLVARFSGDKKIQQNQGFEGGSTSYITSLMSTVFKATAEQYSYKL